MVCLSPSSSIITKEDVDEEAMSAIDREAAAGGGWWWMTKTRKNGTGEGTNVRDTRVAHAYDLDQPFMMIMSFAK